MPELLLHYIWQQGLYAALPQATDDGRVLQVLDPGVHNRDAGPDFSGARIRLTTLTPSGAVEAVEEWVGSVELHVRASDWYRHRHDTDPAYDRVILHVVRDSDRAVCTSQGKTVVQCVLRYPMERDYLGLLLASAREMDSPLRTMRCAKWLPDRPELLTAGWRDTLLRQRMECKREAIGRLLELTHNDWEQAFYISLARNFGFHTNSAPFEQLAIQTPLPYLRKHRDSLFQLTALLLGQSGLLDGRAGSKGSDEALLQKEYSFLRVKFSLTPVEAGLWKQGRIRPQNAPKTRIRQFAALIHRSEFLFSRLMQGSDIESLRGLFDLGQDFAPALGRASLDILLINTVLPYRYAHALSVHDTAEAERALRLMADIPAEDNSIIRQWRMLGQAIRNAADTQALLHLYQTYCQPQACINCDVAYRIFMQQV